MTEGKKKERSFKDMLKKASGDADESFVNPLDKKQMLIGEGPEGSATNQDLCTCKTHHPKNILYYCKTHDKPGCGDCMTIKHTNPPCTKDRVQDISKGFKQTNKFQEIDQELQQCRQEVEKLAGVLDDDLKNLIPSYNNDLLKIAAVREQKNRNLDPIKKELKEKATEMKNNCEKKLKALIEEVKSKKSELDDIIPSTKQRLATLRSDIASIKESQEEKYDMTDEISSDKLPLGKLTGTPEPVKRKKKEDAEQPYKRTKHESNIQEKHQYK